MAATFIISNNKLCYPLQMIYQSNSMFNCGISSTSTSFNLQSRRKLGFGSSRATYEDLPVELVEDSKFVPLSEEDEKYGPPALLLLGFLAEEAEKIHQLLRDLEGEFLEVIFCTESMISGSLWDAVNTKQQCLETSKIALELPRICFLSGLTGEEMMMFIDAFPESGLEPPVFAALVPNSANKPLTEVIEEIMGDHQLLSQREELS